MIGRKAIVGLSLLSALLFCALGAQSASAKGTTAVTCVKGGGNLDFEDAHCDKEVPALTGKFGHVAIAPGKSTLVHLTNAKTASETTASTPFVLTGEVLKLKSKITCTTANGETNKIINEEIAGEMVNRGENGGSANFTGCTVNEPKGCTVNEPIVTGGRSITKTNLEGKEEMGVEFLPPEGSKIFTTITYGGGLGCALNGVKANVEGSAIGTGKRGSTSAVTSSGATLEFTKAMTEKTLKFAGNPASVTGILTVSMANETTGATENPIALTTTTN